MFATFAASVAVGADVCNPPAIDDWANVTYVHDGDTLWLDDGVKVRVIGLNAPERARRNKPGEPLAERAREALHRWAAGNRVGLLYDVEKRDRYGRALAHVYSESRVNLAAQIIAEGLAHAVTFPPNVKLRRCYRTAEQTARTANAGVWSHSYFDPVAAAQVNRGGFMRVKGCVKHTRNRRVATYLQLAPRFRLKMLRADLDGILKPLVRHSPPNFSGACIIARGWVHNNKSSNLKTLTIRHPDNIETISRP